MPAIEVSNLQKTFQTKRKAAGMGGSVRSLFTPQYSSVEAVRGLSFQMEAGELLGFIGPNGAGKSTTIKILTGILHPTGGEAKVLGYVPWKDRQKLAYHIGMVFGQRPQLWYHLPAIDTFTLFGKIFEMDDRETKMRIGQLAEAFEIGDLLETPVRKLSLGQRMRCEVAASLLHRPKLILLDEPSIGLDVVAKQHIRDAIREMAQLENVGVLLTSHDAGDLEVLGRLAQSKLLAGFPPGRGESVALYGAIPGEVVDVEIQEKKRDYSVGYVVGVVEPSAGVGQRGDPGGGGQQQCPEGPSRGLAFVALELEMGLQVLFGQAVDPLAVEDTMGWAHGSLR